PPLSVAAARSEPPETSIGYLDLLARCAERREVAPLQSSFTRGRDLIEELQVLPANVGPEHRAGVFVRLAPRVRAEVSVLKVSERGVSEGAGVAEGYDQAAALGQHFF